MYKLNLKENFSGQSLPTYKSGQEEEKQIDFLERFMEINRILYVE